MWRGKQFNDSLKNELTADEIQQKFDEKLNKLLKQKLFSLTHDIDQTH